MRGERHWLHPQTVPRGFLRLYILTLMSAGPQSGYSIIQNIEEKTEGAWRPGPGTMYPLLKGLRREGLVKASEKGGRGASKTYVLTTKGVRELDEIREVISKAGQKEGVMARLFSDLLPGRVWVPMIVRRFRDGSALFKEKAAEVPPDERRESLEELRVVLKSMLEWVDAQLSPGEHPSRGRV